MSSAQPRSPLPIEPPDGLSDAEQRAWRHLRPLATPRGALRLEAVAGQHHLTIDNPQARGAISTHMMLELSALSLSLAGDSAPIVMVGADERALCAGGDLREVRSSLLLPGGGEAMHTLMVASLQRLLRRPGPVVALLRGAALGGGAELLTWPDHIVAESSGRIGFPQLRLGLSPGWGGGARLVSRVGDRAAKRLLLSGAAICAAEALELGLIDRLVPIGQGVEAAVAAGAQLAALPAGALQAARRLAGLAVPDDERALFLERWGGPLHRAALATAPQGRGA